MLVDASKRFVTQREFPRLAKVGTEIIGNELILSMDGKTLALPLVPQNSELVSKDSIGFFDKSVEGIRLDLENDAIRDFFGEDFLLYYMDDSIRRPISERFDTGNDIVSFADGYPLLAISTASVAEVSRRMEADLPFDRFRPNILIENDIPFEEDRWGSLTIGEQRFRVTKPCARCVIPTIDQSTGTKTGKEPSATLAAFRKASEVYPDSFEDLGCSPNDVLFGINIVPEGDLKAVSIGDEVVPIVS